jgi:hypothetical protein
MTFYENTPLAEEPCSICGGPRRKGRRLPYCHICGARINTQKTTAELRLKAIEAYGGKCSCCGEDEPLFLQFHHVNGDGHVLRKEHGNGGPQFLRWLIREGYPNNIELLCANCHFGKHMNSGTCPHTAQDNT